MVLNAYYSLSFSYFIIIIIIHRMQGASLKCRNEPTSKFCGPIRTQKRCIKTLFGGFIPKKMLLITLFKAHFMLILVL
jgi:hypothetical protein